MDYCSGFTKISLCTLKYPGLNKRTFTVVSFKYFLKLKKIYAVNITRICYVKREGHQNSVETTLRARDRDKRLHIL